MVPLLAFGVWSHSQIVAGEFDQVRDRHLLLARNLGAALSRYHRDVAATFNLLAANLSRTGYAGPTDELLRNIGFHNVCLANADTGVVIAAANSAQAPCPATIAMHSLRALVPLATTTATTFSPVMAGPDGGPVIHVVRLVDGNLAIGALTTDYFVQLAGEVSFGEQGHAAIVDQEGNVLAHPLAAWAAERRNIAKISAVQHMLAGETGIAEFYSPALKGDMVAGFTAVDGPGWGVMIPQPVAELYSRAASSQRSTITLLALCLVLAALVSVVIAYHVARPVERIIEATRRARDTTTPSEVETSGGWIIPRELNELQIGFNDMAGRLRQNLGEIRHLAFADPITGLPNRQAFRTLAVAEIERLTRLGDKGVLLYIDLDEFKALNDTLGHDNGDKVLQILANRLVEAVRAATGRPAKNWSAMAESGATHADGSPVIGRVGGDEFNIFLPGLGETDQLLDILAAVKACLDTPINFGEEVAGIGASIGAACYPQDGGDFDLLRKRADIAMYHAKREGKNRFQIYGDEIGDVTVAELRRSVSRGIKNGEFTLHYQPKIRAGKFRVDGVEALIRWNHPAGRLLTPGAFIPMTENSDVIVELGEWVVRAAAADLNTLTRAGIDTRVSVNISARHFCAPGFVESISDAVMETGIDPSLLELEITEEAVLSNLAATHSAIKQLQASRVRIALDDFGRGYSNLTRVADLAVDTIKIDGPLTARVTTENRVRVIVQSTIEMAQGLGCETVAEGVETLEQAACLTKIGVTHLQGYYFAKPMNFETLQDWIRSQGATQVGEMQALIAEKMKRIA